jgi:26S proteasome regulatory subunit N7
LIDEGGDWDRRNRLKVYQGTYLMSIRNFSEASTMLLDTLATFTCTELYDYKTFVLYTTICAAITLNRPDFKQKVIMAPEVLEVIHEMPHLADYANSFYNCQYDKFFSALGNVPLLKALAALEADLKSDRYLFAHYKFYVREMRITIYNQLLQSYQSLTIESMAKSFGVSEDWIDSDLSKFISLGRVNAVIDKVGGVIETNRPDAKNAQYQSVIKQGDVLLNRIQKLSRVINV